MAGSDAVAASVARAGLKPLSGTRALGALAQFLASSRATGVVCDVDWAQVAGGDIGTRVPLLAGLAETASEAGATASPFLNQLHEAPDSEREGILVRFLQAELQAVLQLPSPPDPAVGFFDLGMDSLMAVEFRNRLSREFAGVYAPSATLVFDYPDTAGLARHLAELLAAQDEAGTIPEKPVRAVRDGNRIAIIGMACRFPGGADLSEFWDQLAAGESAVEEGFPADRIGRPADALRNSEGEDGGRSWGAYVSGIDGFDAEFFRIAPVEAQLMDPQQRLLLETSWQAVEDAGIAPSLLKGSRTAVYAGISSNDYRDLIAGSGTNEANLYMATGNSDSTAIGRVAFTLGLEGPAVAVDTACSSSLVAVHQAVAGLQRREADLALAGGVNVILSPALTQAFTDAGMLAADGQCKTFDASADGFVRGEGCGVMVLKRLGDAERDGDRILGVISGTAVNQDGASAGLTVPNGPAQVRVIEEALSRAGAEPAEVDYLEAHGTGTELGDPIEVQSAALVYGRGRAAERPLLLGSVKTNIGHLEAAAGIAGLIKVVLSMNHGVIPRNLNFREPNPRMDWGALAVRVVSNAMDWPISPDKTMRAGVSSFGFSGTNAHVVVEGYRDTGDRSGVREIAPSSATGASGSSDLSASPPAASPTLEKDETRLRGARLLPLSGKSDQALGELAGRYLSWLSQRSGAPASAADGAAGVGDETPATLLADMAWTSSVGRSHFDCRGRASVRWRCGAEGEARRIGWRFCRFAVSDRANGCVRVYRAGQPVDRHGQSSV